MSIDRDVVYHVWSGSFDDFEAEYTKVAEAGIGSIVLTALRGNLDLRRSDDLRRAGEVLGRLGLAAPACHCQDWGPCHLNESDEADWDAMIAMHVGLMESVAQLGCRTFVLHIGSEPRVESRQASWDRVRKAVDTLATRAAELDMILGLENGMQGYLATNEELLAFVAGYGHDTVGICYDSGHAHVMGDAPGVLKAFSPYVVTVHLHDNDGVDDLHLLPGQGTIDWPPVVAALADCPRLIHIETEAANCPQWPHSRDIVGYREAYQRYLDLLKPGG